MRVEAPKVHHLVSHIGANQLSRKLHQLGTRALGLQHSENFQNRSMAICFLIRGHSRNMGSSLIKFFFSSHLSQRSVIQPGVVFFSFKSLIIRLEDIQMRGEFDIACFFVLHPVFEPKGLGTSREKLFVSLC